MKKPILDLYRQLLSGDVKFTTGLCVFVENNFGRQMRAEFDEIMAPTYSDQLGLFHENKNALYWGSDHYSWMYGELTPLRETILLLFAAYRGEL